MKKQLLLAAFVAAFSFSAIAQDAAKPTTAPAKPDKAAEDVQGIFGNAYANTYNFNVLGWGGVEKWEPLVIEETNILYTEAMKWEIMTNWDTAKYDLSAYEKLHFDVWVPQKSHITLTIEALSTGDGGSGYIHGVDFTINEGWNTIDADLAWWNYKDADDNDITYDWKDVKYVIFEGYKLDDDDKTSAEGKPFAFTNIYFWKAPAPKWPETAPANAPDAPTAAEGGIQALYSTTYQTRTYNFAPTSWGSAWQELEYANGEKIWFTESFGWDAFTNWDANSYNLTDYDMLYFDLYVTVDAEIKVTFEALGTNEGGSGWKNGYVYKELKANTWNKVNIDLLTTPLDNYDFKDLRYLILEGFTSEGTPLGIANIYFYKEGTLGVENTTINQDKATKQVIDGQIVISVNGKKYNVLGAEL